MNFQRTSVCYKWQPKTLKIWRKLIHIMLYCLTCSVWQLSFSPCLNCYWLRQQSYILTYIHEITMLFPEIMFVWRRFEIHSLSPRYSSFLCSPNVHCSSLDPILSQLNPSNSWRHTSVTLISVSFLLFLGVQKSRLYISHAVSV